MNKKYFHFPLILIILFLSSCREEIIPPDNPAGNINEPSLFSSGSTYIFSINAINMSTNFTYNIPFNAATTRLYSLLEDYTSGFVEIKIRSNQEKTLYSGVFYQNSRGSSLNVEGDDQENIQLRFVNFTGKLKIQLSPVE
jgi:hypothetical protein